MILLGEVMTVEEKARQIIKDIKEEKVIRA